MEGKQRMSIKECLLDRNNTECLNGETVGEAILASGGERLYEERDTGIDTIIIHYISAAERVRKTPFDLNEILRIFIDFGVSSHYLITREGYIYNLVPEDKKAWHCGGSIMPESDSREGVNRFSIGIEFVATQSSGFTEEQYDSGAFLCSEIERRRGRLKYAGHEDVAGSRAVSMGLRKDVKADPGPLFDWSGFSERIENWRV